MGFDDIEEDLRGKVSGTFFVPVVFKRLGETSAVAGVEGRIGNRQNLPMAEHNSEWSHLSIEVVFDYADVVAAVGRLPKEGDTITDRSIVYMIDTVDQTNVFVTVRAMKRVATKDLAVGEQRRSVSA